MLSKRDKLFLAAQTMGCLACPSCGSPLSRTGDDLACANRHRINVNRKGCLNVLSSQVDSCYDADLFAARRRVFDAGCYNTVADAIDSLLPAGDHRILDAGCGEGYYTSGIYQALCAAGKSPRMAGIDISKFALKKAAKPGDVILFKGSHGMHLELVLEAFLNKEK